MSELLDVDHRIYDLAGEFLMDTFPEAEQLSDRKLEIARCRLAKAMQQALDAECSALRKELQA